MLRYPQATSRPEDFTGGEWRHALADPGIAEPGAVERVLLCSGKIRWELARERQALGQDATTAIVTLERLYPLPAEHLAEVLALYPNAADFRYVQDEPANQGAWWFLKEHLPPALRAVAPNLDLNLTPVVRPPSSAPAVGSHHEHEAQQQALLAAAFA
jgi:2-oxoglutarate dehydrogenase E1 component